MTKAETLRTRILICVRLSDDADQLSELRYVTDKFSHATVTRSRGCERVQYNPRKETRRMGKDIETLKADIIEALKDIDSVSLLLQIKNELDQDEADRKGRSSLLRSGKNVEVR